MKKTLLPLFCTAALLLSGCAPTATEGGNAPGGTGEAAVDVRVLSLSDKEITLDGVPVTDDLSAPVHTGAELVYYRDGTDETYGEGEAWEKHTQQEAAQHRVVTITRPGTYRLSGTLSRGQIAVDLGENAAADPEAVVTLVLDGADVTCTVAPALIFYNVYECGSKDTDTAGAQVDTRGAGANIVLAAGSENTFTGSHVARIYKEGTTKKLHKYDGAFYSKMTMNILGDGGDDSGVLRIVGDNEGLGSELHFTMEGGTVFIEAQDDGVNTNEDYVSVTTINGGFLTVNAGLGAEGDGIDSNGWLVVNGGTVVTAANERSPDGGIDADCDILLNGGTLSALGTRNDAVGGDSAQPYMELSFASTLPAGSVLSVADEGGAEVWNVVTPKTCQSVTLTVPTLTLGVTYQVYADGVLQCYSSAGSGMRRPGGGQLPEGMKFPEGMEPPEGMERPEGMEPPEGMEFPEGMERPERKNPPKEMEFPKGMELPEGFDGGRRPGGMGGFGGQNADGSGSTVFVLQKDAMSFSGVCDSDASGKTRITFTVDGTEQEAEGTLLPEITALTPSVEIDPALVQVTVTDRPSEDYAASCTLNQGLEAVNDLLPDEPGNYLLTVAVSREAEGYTGTTQISFRVPEEI